MKNNNENNKKPKEIVLGIAGLIASAYLTSWGTTTFLEINLCPSGSLGPVNAFAILIVGLAGVLLSVGFLIQKLGNF